MFEGAGMIDSTMKCVWITYGLEATVRECSGAGGANRDAIGKTIVTGENDQDFHTLLRP